MGKCNISKCCKDKSECLQIPEYENFLIVHPDQIKEEAYNDKILSKKYHELLNEIRINPSKYIAESRTYNLAEIFIKLKPNNPIQYSEENINNIISYLKEEQEETRTSIHQKERDIANMIHHGNIKKLCMFETNTISDDLEENLWHLLQQNEDDIEQILSVYYEFIIILCLPLNNELSRLIFIFYNQT